MKLSFISSDRFHELFFLWDSETNEPDTHEWRDNLSESEGLLVASWDKAFSLGSQDVCKLILNNWDESTNHRIKDACDFILQCEIDRCNTMLPDMG